MLAHQMEDTDIFDIDTGVSVRGYIGTIFIYNQLRVCTEKNRKDLIKRKMVFTPKKDKKADDKPAENFHTDI